MRRWAVLAALVPAVAAAAGQRPPIMPQRDVDVMYEVAQPVPGGPALGQRMRWSVATGRLRVDPPSPGLYMIVDYPAKRMSVVRPAEAAVLDLPTAAPGLPGAPPGDYVPGGSAVVAGLPCQQWTTADGAGQPTQLCLTADGVMLQASQGGVVLLRAVSVSYGPQDAALFVPPANFRHVSGSTAG